MSQDIYSKLNDHEARLVRVESEQKVFVKEVVALKQHAEIMNRVSTLEAAYKNIVDTVDKGFQAMQEQMRKSNADSQGIVHRLEALNEEQMKSLALQVEEKHQAELERTREETERMRQENQRLVEEREARKPVNLAKQYSLVVGYVGAIIYFIVQYAIPAFFWAVKSAQ